MKFVKYVNFKVLGAAVVTLLPPAGPTAVVPAATPAATTWVHSSMVRRALPPFTKPRDGQPGQRRPSNAPSGKK